MLMQVLNLKNQIYKQSLIPLIILLEVQLFLKIDFMMDQQILL